MNGMNRKHIWKYMPLNFLCCIFSFLAPYFCLPVFFPNIDNHVVIALSILLYFHKIESQSELDYIFDEMNKLKNKDEGNI